jgi:drug/metabolite transporter (DMT)-like permease
MGYLFCLGAFLCIGSYLVPSRYAKSAGLNFLPLMGVGLLLGAAILSPYLMELIRSPRWLAAALFSGLLWCLGQCSANVALAEISLAKGSAIFNFNTLINLAAGLLLFGEGAKPGSVPWIVSGGLLLFLGTVWVAWAQAAPHKERNLAKGVFWSFVASVCWGLYFLPLVAIRGMDPVTPFGLFHILAGLMAGGGLSALAVGLFVRSRIEWRRDLPKGLASAALWIVGTGFFLMAISTLGLAKTVPVVNANVLVYAAWSLFFFKELPLSQTPRVLGGCAAIALGIALIARG